MGVLPKWVSSQSVKNGNVGMYAKIEPNSMEFGIDVGFSTNKKQIEEKREKEFVLASFARYYLLWHEIVQFRPHIHFMHFGTY